VRRRIDLGIRSGTEIPPVVRLGRSCMRRSHQGSPDKESIHWHSVHRDIGNPMDVVFMPFEIMNRETPISGK
jgi:hypothetical protein